MTGRRGLLDTILGALGGRRAPSGPAGGTPGAETPGVGPLLDWAAHPDGRPDPGEIVWTWVPYEDDPRQGKDRPVLVVGRRDATTLVVLQMTSKDHDRDEAQEAREGRRWMDIGSGPWDPRGRPSEVRLNRFIDIAEDAIRREGAVLDRGVYEQVIEAARQYLP